MSHGDPDHPDRNPHPVQRYEIIAIAEAPGPWDSVKGYLTYEVVNPACTPENKFLGVHIMPREVGLHIGMTRVDEKTWKGYFYRDYLQDEDYYGLGTCHWDPTSVGGVFVVHGMSFGSGDTLDGLLQKGSETEYFKKSEFLDRSSKIGGYGTILDPAVIRNTEAFFPITVAIREAVQ
ncbi:hypothetical protein [Rhodanobacter lindaniclasticus]|uniref:Uncharacterized protein n=1 Tax=Rhodanobacter lindaniclasticus TaxID=75310 RepID=A0A4S3KEJ6_9GAMM|nr:hypothetical protein [Rhodanobacter lindaniclasticus]THD06965.1 hypothetical protein B1991_11620 [Rhodanobacter lindaniclasticus]